MTTKEQRKTPPGVTKYHRLTIEKRIIIETLYKEGYSKNFRVAPDGTLSAMGKPVVKLEAGKWHRIGIGLRLGPGRVEHVCRLTVTDEKGTDRRFTVPIPRRFTCFNWIGIHSCGVGGRYYIDDFRITDVDSLR